MEAKNPQAILQERLSRDPAYHSANPVLGMIRACIITRPRAIEPADLGTDSKGMTHDQA